MESLLQDDSSTFPRCKSIFLQQNSSSLQFNDLQGEQQLSAELRKLVENKALIWVNETPFSINIAFSDSGTDTKERYSATKYENVVVDEADINQFINLVDVTCLESGYYSNAENYIINLCEKRGYPYVINLMNEIYVKHPQDELLMCTIINILSHIDYNNLGSLAITICMAMIAVGTPLIWEYVINACDTWGRIEFISCLEAINTDSILLKRMIQKVVSRIKKTTRDNNVCTWY